LQINDSCIRSFGICAVLASEHLQLGNIKEAEELAHNAMEAAGHTNQSTNIYEAYAEGILGEVLFAVGNFKESAEHFHRALKVYEHHTRSRYIKNLLPYLESCFVFQTNPL